MGNDADNLGLSKRRAASVRAYLADKGIEQSRLESEGYGEERPLCEDIPESMLGKRSRDKEIEECRGANRRVEFKIIEIEGKPIKAASTVEIETGREVIEP